MTKPHKLLIVIHGIRDEGTWMEVIKSRFQSETTTVQPIDFDDFGALQFIIGRGVQKVIREATRKVRYAKSAAEAKHGNVELIAIGHSFGTFVLLKMLEEHPDIVFKRVIFCGSVVPKSFRFDTLKNAPEFLNECGGKDLWPVIAEGFGFGRYGAAGVWGLRVTGVEDRFHDFRHGDYLNDEFIKEYWAPYLETGQVVSSPYQNVRRKAPRGVRLLSRGYFLILGLALIFFLPLVLPLFVEFKDRWVTWWSTCIACWAFVAVFALYIGIGCFRFCYPKYRFLASGDNEANLSFSKHPTRTQAFSSPVLEQVPSDSRRSPASGSSSIAIDTDTMEVVVKVNRPFSSFSESQKTKFLDFVRTVLESDEDPDHEIEQGSVIIKIKGLSPEHAERLKWAIEQGQLDDEYFEDPKVTVREMGRKELSESPSIENPKLDSHRPPEYYGVAMSGGGIRSSWVAIWPLTYFLLRRWLLLFSGIVVFATIFSASSMLAYLLRFDFVPPDMSTAIEFGKIVFIANILLAVLYKVLDVVVRESEENRSRDAGYLFLINLAVTAFALIKLALPLSVVVTDFFVALVFLNTGRVLSTLFPRAVDYDSFEKLSLECATPVLGVLPFVRFAAKNAAYANIDKSVACIHEPRSEFSEAIRGLRTAIFFSSAKGDLKVIQVTSPQRGDGKSTVAANLAVSISNSGRNVCLVDCDFRNPSIHKLFGNQPYTGLVQALTGQATLDKVLQPTSIANLTLLTLESVPTRPMELLSNGTLSMIFEELRSRFDYVIVDSSSVQTTSDALMLSSVADCVVLAVRFQRILLRRHAVRTVQVLGQMNANTIGIVVNGARRQRRPVNYHYGYYHGKS